MGGVPVRIKHSSGGMSASGLDDAPGIRVLFVYPTYRNMLSPAIGLLAAVLTQCGHEVRLFDTAYYAATYGHGESMDADVQKSERLQARPYEMPEELQLKTTSPFDDLLEQVDEFEPDLLAMSCTEDMWGLGVQLLRHVRERREILTIVGGVFPTFGTRLALSNEAVDIVCKGEGEDALAQLCDRLALGQPYDDVANLWIKSESGDIRENPIQMVDMDANPLIDAKIFDYTRYYRPMGGRVWRMFPVETHRGCPYKCAFCNSPSQMAMYREELGENFLRRKSFRNIEQELLYYKEEMGAEYLYFWADTFFSWKPGEFEEFAKMYERIGLPFWCQTRVETVEIERLRLLKEIGCARLSFGLEHGNPEFRTKWLKRRMTNEMIVKNFGIVNEVGIPFSVNNIVGFPHETRELAFDTVYLNREFECNDRSAYVFTPFQGTPLRAECDRLGFTQPDQIVQSSVPERTALDMPQFPRSEVLGLVKTFNMYVHFDEVRWPEIRKAEGNAPEAKERYEALKAEFVSTFWDEDDTTSFEEAATAFSM